MTARLRLETRKGFGVPSHLRPSPPYFAFLMRSADFALALPNFVTAVEIAKTVKCAACACLSFPSPRSRAGLDPQFFELILTRPGVMASPSFDRVIENSNRRQNQIMSVSVGLTATFVSF